MRACHVKAISHLVSDIPDVIHGDRSAEELIDRLRALGDASALMVSIRNPFGGANIPLLSSGYDPPLLSYLNREYLSCVSYAEAISANRPMRMVDFGEKFYRTPVYETYLHPAGYDEGITQVLRTRNGQISGLLTMSFSRINTIDDEIRECLEMAGPALGKLTDFQTIPKWLAWQVDRSASAYLVSRDGAVTPVQTNNRCGASVEVAAEAVLAAREAARYRVEHPVTLRGYAIGSTNKWQKVHITSTTASNLECALILADNVDPPFDLTPRELDVLTLLSTGLTNRQIGEFLEISPRTVGAHVEHILHKTCKPTRSAVSWLAEKEGLRRLAILHRRTEY